MIRAYPDEKVVIILDDLSTEWYPSEIQKVKEMWGDGYHIKGIAKVIRPYNALADAIDEVALLIFDLKRKRQIQKRLYGVIGGFKE
jgi:hypothetical protein